MVVDTSSLVALLLAEPQAAEIAAHLEHSRVSVISAATLVEAMIVVESRLGPDGVLRLEQILREAEIETVPVDDGHARAAVDAWRAYAKGRHRAALNYGDCFTYALADQRGDAVLCVGDDFRRTDLDTVP
jgi:ribonuclease VapC